MNAKLVAAALTAALISPAASAAGEFFTGNSLLTQCAGPEWAAKSMCTGYIIGVHDAGAGSNHCSPDNSTIGQVQDVVLQGLARMPQHRHLSADVLVSAILQATWPCQQQAPSNRPGRTL